MLVEKTGGGVVMDNQYFATLDSELVARELGKRRDEYYNFLRTTGRMNLYHAVSDAYYSGRVDGGSVQNTGKRGEIKSIRSNIFREAMLRFDAMVGNVKPVFKARAANSDNSSVESTRIIDDAFEHFQKKVEFNDKTTQARHTAEKYGEAWGWTWWDRGSGKDYVLDDTTGRTEREGNPRQEVLFPTDVVRDVTARGKDAWLMCRQFCNKFEYAALLEEGPGQKAVLDQGAYRFDRQREVNPIEERSGYSTEIIILWHFYHEASTLLPNGRHLVMTDGCRVVVDEEWPDEIPLVRLSPEVEATDCVGYSWSFDSLPLWQAFNSLQTMALTNCNQYGNPTLVSTGKVQVKQIKDKFTIVQKEPGTELGPLAFPATPPEVYAFAEMLADQLNRKWGISVAQTGSEESIKQMPGNALAFLESTTIRYAAPFQQSYNRYLERNSTILMKTVIKNMPGQRMLEVVGKDQKPYLQGITAEQLSGFTGFFLDVGNPALQTVQGNEQLAKDLAAVGMVKTAAEYSFVRETGRVDLFISPESEENMLMLAENEKIRNGENPIVLVTDNHALHIKTNSGPLKSVEARENPAIVEAGTAHILEHIRIGTALENAGIVAAMGSAPQGAAPVAEPVPEGPSPEEVVQEGPTMPDNPLTGETFDGATGGGVVAPQ